MAKGELFSSIARRANSRRFVSDFRRNMTMAYWFFFSYAHADYNEYLGTFYRDLEGEVRQLTGDPLAGIGFLDRKDIEHGATWDAALEQGLKNCRVFVPLYSPSYFRALYC